MLEVETRTAAGDIVDAADDSPFVFGVTQPLVDGCRRADFNNNQVVDYFDLFAFADALGSEGASGFDLDGDARVNMSDFFIFVDFFASVCDADAGLEQMIEEMIAADVSMSFVLIEAGSFTMGSANEEEGRNGDEGPQRSVTISNDFYLGAFEVTQSQWEAVMGTTPWDGRVAVEAAADHPAVYVTWNEARDFIDRLNSAAGRLLYRLPTEAEWEYAARGGTNTVWSFGDDASLLEDYAWFRRDPRLVDELTTHDVGLKLPNPWGLFDIHGNAAEWVSDYYGAYDAEAVVDLVGPAEGSARVIRGGGGQLSQEQVRSASRGFFAPTVRLSTFGLRVLREAR